MWRGNMTLAIYQWGCVQHPLEDTRQHWHSCWKLHRGASCRVTCWLTIVCLSEHAQVMDEGKHWGNHEDKNRLLRRSIYICGLCSQFAYMIALKFTVQVFSKTRGTMGAPNAVTQCHPLWKLDTGCVHNLSVLFRPQQNTVQKQQGRAQKSTRKQ